MQIGVNLLTRRIDKPRILKPPGDKIANRLCCHGKKSRNSKPTAAPINIFTRYH